MTRPFAKCNAFAPVLAALLAVAPATASDPPKVPFLWEIGRGPAKSYVFGTIHLSRPEVLSLAPDVDAALKSADSVYTEIPMDPATVLGMMPRMLLPDGAALSEALPPDVYAKLVDTLAAMDPSLTVEPFERFKVWAVAATLATVDEGAASGGVPLDMILYQQAASAGKEVGGLETVEEQIAIFEDLDDREQILMLSETLDLIKEGVETGKSPVDSMVEVYLSGDIEALGTEFEKWMSAGDPDLAARLTESLIVKRNRLMADRIAAKLRAEPTKSHFFAVGAGHLYGGQGIPALLEAAGVPVKRVSGPPD